MTREQLEHVIRASAAIAGVEDIVVIGSQSVLGTFPDAPEDLLESLEADVYPMNHPEMGDLIDGSIGEGSPFQRLFGYYAHGVDDRTAVLPRAWRERLILVAGHGTRNAKGWCPEVHDLAIAKYVAGREKDLSFAHSLASHGMTNRDVLKVRLADTVLDGTLWPVVEGRMERDFAGR